MSQPSPAEIQRVMKALAARGGMAKAGRMSAQERAEMSARMHAAKAARKASVAREC